ncbi:MAG: hypothetical protein KF841_10255 [Phycisphaerae bacterium]|nr:hypothetical protein [Phycisphaerae bacterium]
MNRRPFRIVLAEPFSEAVVNKLRGVGEVTILPDSAPATIIGAMAEADALLVRAKAHVTARIIDSAPKLRVIGRASQTIDHIDLRAAKRRDIPVVYSPNAAVKSAAEFALGLMIASHRHIPVLDSQVREGRFDIARQIQVREFRYAVIGFLGLDPVAEHVGRMLEQAFDSTMIYHDPLGGEPGSFKARSVSFDELLGTSDVLSIHLRQSVSPRRMIDADALAKMKPEATLVNITRGSAINLIALAAALQSGRLSGAALDVFETEPLPLQHPLRRSPNCLLTPHVAGLTIDSLEERSTVADDVIRVLIGEAPRHPAQLP